MSEFCFLSKIVVMVPLILIMTGHILRKRIGYFACWFKDIDNLLIYFDANWVNENLGIFCISGVFLVFF